MKVALQRLASIGLNLTLFILVCLLIANALGLPSFFSDLPDAWRETHRDLYELAVLDKFNAMTFRCLVLSAATLCIAILSRKCFRKGLGRTFGAIAIGMALLNIALFIGCRVYLVSFYNWDDDNAVRVKRNALGRVVRRIERKDGKLNGLFMMDYDESGSVRGFYKDGIEVGEWIGWYPGKRQIQFEMLFDEEFASVTNRRGLVENRPRLVNCTCYAPDGKVCGRVRDGVGDEIRYRQDFSLDFIRTHGYATNYFALFHSDGPLKGQILQLEIVEGNRPLGGNATAPLLEICNYSGTSVMEKGREAFISKDGTIEPIQGDAVPDFILGKTSYAFPRLEGDHLVFDATLFCSNATLHIVPTVDAGTRSADP